MDTVQKFQKLLKIVYVNGQSVLTPKLGNHNVAIYYIEPEFKRLIG